MKQWKNNVTRTSRLKSNNFRERRIIWIFRTSANSIKVWGRDPLWIHMSNNSWTSSIWVTKQEYSVNNRNKSITRLKVNQLLKDWLITKFNLTILTIISSSHLSTNRTTTLISYRTTICKRIATWAARDSWPAWMLLIYQVSLESS